MRSHLLIQGPVISFFTKFCPPNQSPDCVSVNGQLAYDSAKNIARIAETYRGRFDTIVLSTWDNQELPNQSHLESLGVVVKRCDTQSVARLPNYLKQVVGVLEGVKAIGQLDPADRVVKTRTDLWFDLASYVDHTERADLAYQSWRDVGQLGFIHCANSRGPFFLEDMSTSARSQDFVRFWEASLPDRVQLPGGGIHQSLPMEYAWQNRHLLRIPTRMFWDFYRWVAPWHKSAVQLLARNDLWRYLMSHCFCLAPEIECSDFVWRGGPGSHQTNRRRLKRYQFFEQWELLRENDGALSLLTDLNYFEGRRPHGWRDYLSETRRALRIGRIVASSN